MPAQADSQEPLLSAGLTIPLPHLGSQGVRVWEASTQEQILGVSLCWQYICSSHLTCCRCSRRISDYRVLPANLAVLYMLTAPADCVRQGVHQ